MISSTEFRDIGIDTVTPEFENFFTRLNKFSGMALEFAQGISQLRRLKFSEVVIVALMGLMIPGLFAVFVRADIISKSGNVSVFLDAAKFVPTLTVLLVLLWFAVAGVHNFYGQGRRRCMGDVRRAYKLMESMHPNDTKSKSLLKRSNAELISLTDDFLTYERPIFWAANGIDRIFLMGVAVLIVAAVSTPIYTRILF